MQNKIEELKARGIINNITNEEKLLKALKAKSAIYCGFDPTAISLHLGNYVQLIALQHFANLGFKPICILGGATGMIGDPSGKNAERVLLDDKALQKNKTFISKQLKKFNNNGLTLDNLTWTKNISIIEFLRDIGKFVNINYMIQKEQISSRLDSGISYTEFSYMLLQSYDFLHLYKNHHCCVQIGGSDQWGNITSGVELIRKNVGENNLATGVTFNLLTDANNKKFGKSEGGAIWLDPNLTSPYEMYQFLYNQPDQMLDKLLSSLTFLSLKEINKITNDHQAQPRLRVGQKALAGWVVEYIHGKQQLSDAQAITKYLFNHEFDNLSASALEMLTKSLINIKMNDHDLVMESLCDQEVFPSKREARSFIKDKALKINGQVVEEDSKFKDIRPLKSKYWIVQKGRKNFYIIKK